MAEQTTQRAGERPGEAEPTAGLVREALDQVGELVRLEAALARQEVRDELSRAKAAAVALGAAGALAVSGWTMFMVTIALAFKWSWLAALILGGILTFLAAAMALGGWSALPGRPLAQTRERIGADVKQLKERIA